MSLKMRKTSLTRPEPRSVRITSPEIASNGNRRSVFSGMLHTVKSELQTASGVAAAGTDSSTSPARHRGRLARREVIDFLQFGGFDTTPHSQRGARFSP